MRTNSKWEKLLESFEKLKTKIKKGFALCTVLDQRLFKHRVEERKRLEAVARKSGYEAGYYDGYVEAWWGHSWDPPYSDGLPWSVGYAMGYKRGFEDSATRRIHRFDGTDYYAEAKSNREEKGRQETEEKKLKVDGKGFGKDYEMGSLDASQGARRWALEDTESAGRAVDTEGYQVGYEDSRNRKHHLHEKTSYEAEPEIRQISSEEILRKSLPEMFEEWTRQDP